MSWFSKGSKARPPVYFTIGSHQPVTTLDRSAIFRMAFTILITLLEKEGADSFAKIMDSLYIGFSKSGPIVTNLSVLQQEQHLVGYAKLSDIPGVIKARDKVTDYGDFITAQNAEMLLQRDFVQAAEEITNRIFGKPPTPVTVMVPPESDASVSGKLTTTEMSLVRQQIERCWNPPEAAKDLDDFVVDITVEVAQDGRVLTAQITSSARMVDPIYRATAESALRAVLNPYCQPLKLPPGKYSEWKTLRLKFNPKDLL